MKYTYQLNYIAVTSGRTKGQLLGTFKGCCYYYYISETKNWDHDLSTSLWEEQERKKNNGDGTKIQFAMLDRLENS